MIQPNNEYDTDYHKYWQKEYISKQVRFCFEIPSQEVINVTVYANYRVRLDWTVQRFYQLMHGTNDQMGLFWELIRYYNCEWPHQYLMHKLGLKYFKDNNYISFNVDSKFDQNLNRLLNVMNIKDNFDNRQILRKYGYENVNITESRNTLYGMMKKEDLSVHEILADPDHVTKNDYDKQEAIRLLLTLDKSICELIKHMTILLDFLWDYPMYC